MELNPLLAAVVATVVTAAATPLVIRLARRTGVMDHPGPLKPHAAPVPYLGGVAVFAGVTVSLVLTPHPAVVLPLAAALTLGLVDDITSLAVLPRFLAEAAIGVAVAWSVGLGVSVMAAAVVVGTVALINAVNFVDGLDALAAGVCAVSFAGFAVTLGDGWAAAAAALAGASVGFLVFNRPPARIYLGDAGSYLLGTGLAVLATAMLFGARPSSGDFLQVEVDLRDLLLVIPLIGYPLVEAVSTVARRLVSRRPLFAGDRDHVYDQLVRSGRSGAATAAVLIGTQAVVVAAAVGIHAAQATAPALLLAAAVVVATVVAAIPRAVPAA